MLKSKNNFKEETDEKSELSNPSPNEGGIELSISSFRSK